jgi:putative chitinase
MLITAERIMRLAPLAPFTTAEALAPLIEEAMPRFGISSLLSRSHFMAQASWESSQFRRFEENLHYTADRIGQVWFRLKARAQELAGNPEALANAAYANRNGNGDESSGDGWRYRGRGLFQLTGRANYAAAGHGTHLDCLNQPDEIAAPRGGVLSALWFFQSRGCNDAALADDAEAVTRLINGAALEGLHRRLELTENAKRIFA